MRGNKRTAYDIIANNMQMLGSKADSERMTSRSHGATLPRTGPLPSAPIASGEPLPGPESEITDEDIPF